MGTSSNRLHTVTSSRTGKYFTKYSDERWLSPGRQCNSVMFRDKVYASASAALEAYILEYDGISPDSTLTSHRPPGDVETLLSSVPVGRKHIPGNNIKKTNWSAVANSQMASNVSMTLEESQRVLDKINHDTLDVNPKNSDVYSCITDNTDILLQAKPYQTYTSTTRKKLDNAIRASPKSKSFDTHVKHPSSRVQGILPKHFSHFHNEQSTPTWVQDLAQSELSLLSNGNLRENRRLYSSQPRIGDLMDRDESILGKTLSLNDLNPNQLHDSGSSSQQHNRSPRQLLQRVASVEKRNKILRKLLYSHNIVGQGTVLKPVGSETSGAISTPDIEHSGRNVHFNFETADILTSTFQNTPKKLTVDVSSIESANSTDPSYIQNSVKPVRRSNHMPNNQALTDETARRLVSDIPNEKHKQYLNNLIQDIEDSSSSVVTTPWLEVLQRDLGMKTGEFANNTRTHAEREALAAEVEEIIRANTAPSKMGSADELLVPSPPYLCTDLKSRQSLNTEEILDGDRSWEAPVLSLKRPVSVDKTSRNSHLPTDKARIVDEFLTECLGTDKQVNQCDQLSVQQQSGTLETLKNMLFSVQAMTPVDDENVGLEVQETARSEPTITAVVESKEPSLDEAAAVPDELKHLLSVSFDGQAGTESLDKAINHLKNLQTLVRPTSMSQAP